MNPLEIKSLLVSRGVKQVTLATRAKRSVCLVNNVIHGRATSQHVRTVIASAIGMKVKDVWPEAKKEHSKPKRSLKASRIKK